MNVKLPDDIIRELERTGDAPLRVENPRNHKMYVILPEEKFASSDSSVESTSWTEEKNARRCDLIDRDIDGTLTPAEAEELARLERESDEYLSRVAPLPMAQVQQLYDSLLKSANSSEQRQ